MTMKCITMFDSDVCLDFETARRWILRNWAVIAVVAVIVVMSLIVSKRRSGV